MKPRLALASLLVVCSSAVLSQEALRAGFENPPDSAKPHTWWHWINGNISKEGITADLEAMKAIGLGGAQIFNVEVGVPEGRTPFMSPQWKEALAHALSEAKRLGIEICLHNCAGWSSSGGPWVTPDNAMQVLTTSETPVKGPSKVALKLPQPETRLGFYRDIAVYAVKNPRNATFRIPNIQGKAAFVRSDRLVPSSDPVPGGSVVPLVRVLSCGADGTFSWDVPAGEWTIIRLGHTPTGKENHPSPASGLGPECDKLSRAAMDQHWSAMMDAALKANGEVGKFGLNNALIDSYEVHNQNWTPKFREEFKKRTGYDCVPWLPVVTGRVVESAEKSERFLWDYRRVIADLFAENYVDYFGELCRKNGLLFSIEGYGDGPFDNLQVSGMADIPMGEFWVGGGAIESTKLASSAAHTNGRKFVGAESFTADESRAKWLVDPYSIKAIGDRVFSLGINRYIFHRYAHQPWSNAVPGMTMGPWGMNLDRTLTWWDQGKEWMTYISRCQHMLQEGRFVADVLVYAGEEAPNDLPFSLQGDVPDGYDYDGCDTSVLMKLKVEDGELTLPSGMRYRLLVLPQSPWMSARVAKKIETLVKAGAKVIGGRPENSPSLAEGDAGDAVVQRIAKELWGTGRVKSDTSIANTLDDLDVDPDFAVVAGPKGLNWIHRRQGATDWYFVANPKRQPVDVTVSLRAGGRVPDLWNPETGKVEEAREWQFAGLRTNVRLSLGPAGSTFIVLDRSTAATGGARVEHSAIPTAETRPKVEVVSARYEAVDGTGGADVAGKLAQLLADGETEIGATNANFGDPTVNHLKHLVAVLRINGEEKRYVVAENDVLTVGQPANEDDWPAYEWSNGQLLSWKAGTVKVTTATGVVTTKKVTEAESWTVTTPWRVEFPPNLGAPDSVTLDKLGSWTDSPIPGVRYFSGTATYSTSFEVPDNLLTHGPRLFLDLGRVKNFAEVSVNGKLLPTLWKPPFRHEVTGLLRPGNNKIVVKVTNLWPNRIIGDEQLPEESTWNGNAIAKLPDWALDLKPRPKSPRVTFSTWRVFSKDSPLYESGLIGPVRFVSPEVIEGS